MYSDTGSKMTLGIDVDVLRRILGLISIKDTILFLNKGSVLKMPSGYNVIWKCLHYNLSNFRDGF